jgi:hypothetical protein
MAAYATPSDMTEQESQPSSRFEKYVVPALVGIATSLISIYATHHFTAARLRADFDQQLKMRDIEEMQEVHANISGILDRRLQATRRLLDLSERGANKSEYNQRLAEYRAAVDAWNTSLNLNLTRVDLLFGADARDELENRIGEGFKNLNSAMTRDRRTPLSDLNAQVNAINSLVADFNRHLSEKIKARRTRPPCE